MIDEIKQAIVSLLNSLYPDRPVLDENADQQLTNGYFFIDVSESAYQHSINGSFKGSVTFDLSYFPANGDSPRSECLAVQDNLLRSLNLVEGFRILSKKAIIVEKVLHVSFTVKFLERAERTTTVPMQIIKEIRRS